MASVYSDIVKAVQTQPQLFVEYLVKLAFKSETRYLWTGLGPFFDTTGQGWEGVGVLGKVSDIDRALVSSSTPTLSLSNLDADVAAKALDANNEVKGQLVTIYEQYFDQNQAPVAAPLALWSGIMNRVTVNVSLAESSVTLTTATILYRRRRPALAYLSDASQQTLYPGDTGCSEIARLVQATENWPNY